MRQGGRAKYGGRQIVCPIADRRATFESIGWGSPAHKPITFSCSRFIRACILIIRNDAAVMIMILYEYSILSAFGAENEETLSCALWSFGMIVAWASNTGGALLIGVVLFALRLFLLPH